MVNSQGVGQLSQLRIATRQSRLALWQAQWVQARLQERYPGVDASLVGLTTSGDQILDRPLAAIGGKGLFIKELELALQAGRAELAVHSYKDVPMEVPEGFAIVAVIARADPRDAFLSAHYGSIEELPQGAVVGTSSLRRAVQLCARRPDLKIASLRGNVDTRLARLDAGDYDAIVLAAAGLKRLGLAERIRALLPVSQMLPAPGQGAIAIETRSADAHCQQAVAFLNDRPTALAVAAERALARSFNASCQTPLGAYAAFEVQPGAAAAAARLRLDALIADQDGRIRRAHAVAPVAEIAAAEALGAQVAAALI